MSIRSPWTIASAAVLFALVHQYQTSSLSSSPLSRSFLIRRPSVVIIISVCASVCLSGECRHSDRQPSGDQFDNCYLIEEFFFSTLLIVCFSAVCRIGCDSVQSFDVFLLSHYAITDARFANKRTNKVITTRVIRPLDDRTYCVREAFTHLGRWRKLYDCSLHHFTARQCGQNVISWHFCRSSTIWSQFDRGDFSTPGLREDAAGQGQARR